MKYRKALLAAALMAAVANYGVMGAEVFNTGGTSKYCRDGVNHGYETRPKWVSEHLIMRRKLSASGAAR